MKQILAILEIVNGDLRWKNVTLVNHNYTTRYAHTAQIFGNCLIISFGIYIIGIFRFENKCYLFVVILFSY